LHDSAQCNQVYQWPLGKLARKLQYVRVRCKQVRRLSAADNSWLFFDGGRVLTHIHSQLILVIFRLSATATQCDKVCSLSYESTVNVYWTHNGHLLPGHDAYWATVRMARSGELRLGCSDVCDKYETQVRKWNCRQTHHHPVTASPIIQKHGSWVGVMIWLVIKLATRLQGHFTVAGRKAKGCLLNPLTLERFLRDWEDIVGECGAE